MSITILNRANQLPDDGWFPFEAPGEHINHAARVIQVIDNKAVSSIVSTFNADARSANFAGIPVDKDHLGKDADKPSEALGWVMALRDQNGTPEARIDWTSLGKPLVTSAPGVPPAYKFFSTEYDPSECEKIGTRVIGKKTYDVVRPLRLAGLSLTNQPNNKGQRPISNRQPMHADADETRAFAILNRASTLLTANPAAGFVACWKQAEREIPSASADAAAVMANRVYNRALELTAAAPRRSLSDCWMQAQNELA